MESDKIKAYDQKPEMHADDIAEVVLEALEEGEKEFILLNFANCDLVGHTGDLNAAIEAVETVDRNIGRLVEKVRETDYELLITADHGNCEDMGSEENPNTSHTLNLVPLIQLKGKLNGNMSKLTDVRELVEASLELT